MHTLGYTHLRVHKPQSTTNLGYMHLKVCPQTLGYMHLKYVYLRVQAPYGTCTLSYVLFLCFFLLIYLFFTDTKMFFTEISTYYYKVHIITRYIILQDFFLLSLSCQFSSQLSSQLSSLISSQCAELVSLDIVDCQVE